MRGYEHTTSQPATSENILHSPRPETQSNEEQQFPDVAQSQPSQLSVSNASNILSGLGIEGYHESERHDQVETGITTPDRASSPQDVSREHKSDFSQYSANIEPEPSDPRIIKLAKSVRSRRRLVYLRNKREIEIRNYAVSRLHYSSTRDEFLLSCNKLKAELKQIQGISGDVVNNITAVMQTLNHNDNSLRMQENLMGMSETALSAQEMKMIRLDNRLMSLERNALAGDEFDSEAETTSADVMDDEDIDALGTLSAYSDSSIVHPTAAVYYDKVGDMILARDHIHNLDADYRSSLYLRKSRKDMGVLPLNSDASLHNEYLERRGALEKDFTEAKTLSSSALAECLQLNIPLEKAQIPDLQPPEPEPFPNQSPDLEVTNSRVVTWIAETEPIPLEDITEQKSPIVLDSPENQPIEDFSSHQS